MEFKSKFDITHPEKSFKYVYFMHENSICCGRIERITSTTVWADYRYDTPRTVFEYVIKYIKERLTLNESQLFESKEELIKKL